ncbi:growth/differentiatio [Genypterus blacodes]|uniref:growth/differentiatio n=1 Tax=Genypterus blacodes TaxID=154954 RepID=UPI003F760EDB
MMEKQTQMSDVLRHLRLVIVLILLTCTCPPAARSSHAASNALHSPGDSARYPYGSIFSPLLKALSDHGGSRWGPGMKKKKLKPDHRYIKYLTEVYEKSSRVQRSLDGSSYNTVRLIKPQDECLAVRSHESFMQDLSYSFDQVSKNEQLVKSTLLYSFDNDRAASINSVCYLSTKEEEHSHQCQLCPGAYHTVNFTVSTDRWSRRSWVEVDVTTFLQPRLKFHRKNLHLSINITCPEDQKARGDGRISPLEFSLRSPPLILYFNDISKNPQRSLVKAKIGQRSATAETMFHKKMVFQPEQRIGHKRRLRRESPKSKKGDKSFHQDIHLPELLPSSEFPTSDCALYDFRVRFSQLKLDHWIVFPPKYNPRYCKGICPRTMGFMYGSPVHAMVQNIINEKLDASVPRPSCIPSHYNPLSVMIFEEDGSYVYKEFEDMIATRCTCR